MPEEIQLKLVFANDHNSANLSIATNTQVKEVKKIILQRHWPDSPNLIPAEQVERIRLFAAGKELGGKGSDDSKTLKDAQILISPNGPTPVHVMAVQKDGGEKAVESTENPSKTSSQCFCTLL
mmetsp:Transcript_22562/g.27802  ORF Transcript_22562/g.27802 Transcript_22562/m.27802 type:complete len:123 (+) Transcript_22562:109-477(+)